jgi:EAL domain-containing protein (putative c-di-GMP-specific phosphodiesterase class I)
VSRLDARYLELEVTESVIMHDAERVTAALEALKRMGLELAIDDFGTGYSSLSYLKRFPIDRLKIDQSFVRDIPSDAEDAAIIGAIIGLTRNLGLRTIAEGVETSEQLEFLRGQGCDEVQGYLLSRPLTPEACAQLLREGKVMRVLRAA